MIPPDKKILAVDSSIYEPENLLTKLLKDTWVSVRFSSECTCPLCSKPNHFNSKERYIGRILKVFPVGHVSKNRQCGHETVTGHRFEIAIEGNPGFAAACELTPLDKNEQKRLPYGRWKE